MADNMAGQLRRSAVVMTYAPGSIVDMRADDAPVSGVAAGLEEWDHSAPLANNLKYQRITERRLCKKLGKKYFRLPPVIDEDALLPNGRSDDSSLVLRRFPEWLQCPMCEILKPARHWAQQPGRAYRYCAACSQSRPGGKKVYVVPVRFVTACRKGHLDEFPWHWWLKHKEGCRKTGQLRMRSTGPGLAGLLLECLECKTIRNLDGAFGKRALSGLTCQAKRPWLRANDADCDCTGDNGNYRVLQRGASNMYYPVMESALDVPPWTHRLEQELGDYWDSLAGIPDLEERARFISVHEFLSSVVRRLGITPSELAVQFQQMLDAFAAVDINNIRLDEYRVFTGGIDERDSEFETCSEVVSPEINTMISQVVRVARLREVRVVKGFTRISPPYDPDGSDISPLSVAALDWLPAIQVRGEGIFLRLLDDKLRQWEQQATVLARTAEAEKTWDADWKSRYPDKPKPFRATPRLLMIHSLAHVLMRQLTLECGYSTASLRERIYVGDDVHDMAGVLIYTATPDSDGTLGGLQRRADAALITGALIDAVRAVEWCSSDPLCISGSMVAPESHSIASCHSCMMMPETSCEYHNRFLDRALLVGTDSNRDLGYFSKLLSGIE